MYTIKRKEVKVPQDLGGQQPTADTLAEECFEWLEEAAGVAENLIRQKSFTTIFTKYATDDSVNAEQLEDLRDRLINKVTELSVRICISEIGIDMASYVRGGSLKAPINKDIFINKTLLRDLYLCWKAAPNKAGKGKKSKTELRRQWVALLAVKIWHETQHLLLTAVDSRKLKLLAFEEDDSRVTPEMKFGKAAFRDFGNLMEAAAFGGMLTVENWPLLQVGDDLLLAQDESWDHLQVVTSVESIYEGRLIPITVDKKRKKDSPIRKAKRSKRASSSTSSSSSAPAQVATSSQARSPQKLIPKRLWSTHVGKATKRS